MRKNSYKNFRLASLPFLFILKSVKDPDLGSKSEVFSQLQQSVLHIPHNSFPYQKT